MSLDDELRSHLSGKASSIDAVPATMGEAQARGRRRARRNRALGVFGVFALIVGVAIGLRPLFDDASVIEVAAVDDTVTATAPPLSTGSIGIPGPDSGDDRPSAPPGPGRLIDRSVASTSFYYGGGGDRVVPWGDGFLWIGTERQSAPLPGADTAIAKGFPPEIVEAILAAEARTIDEAAAALSEAGLLESATELLAENPELAQWYESTAAEGSTATFARVSDDGLEWTDHPGFSSPFGDGTIDRVASDGEHLVLSSQTWSESDEGDGSGRTSTTVAVTADLQTWDIYDVTPAVADGPAYLQSNSWLSDLTIGPDGWLAVLQTSIYLDLWSLLPADVRNWPGGADLHETEDGLEVTLYANFRLPLTDDLPVPGPVPSPDELPVPTPAPLISGESEPEVVPLPAIPTPDGCCVPEETRFYSWEELGVDPLEFQAFRTDHDAGGSEETILWIGPWDGTVESSLMAGLSGSSINMITGTEAGFLGNRWSEDDGSQQLVFSADGVTWTVTEQPGGDIWSLVAVDGGVVVTTGGISGPELWRGEPDGSAWQLVDLPDEFAGLHINLDPGVMGGAVGVVDIMVYPDRSPAEVEFTVDIEVDGFEIRLSSHADGTSDLLVTNIESGEVVADPASDLDEFSEEVVRQDEDSVTIVDDDGVDIVSIPIQLLMDALVPAREAAVEATGLIPPPPIDAPLDLRILASIDGIKWTAIDFRSRDTFKEWPVAMGINGDTVVVRTSEGWQSYPIG